MPRLLILLSFGIILSWFVNSNLYLSISSYDIEMKQQSLNEIVNIHRAYNQFMVLV